MLQLGYFRLFNFIIFVVNKIFTTVNIVYIWANFGHIYKDLIVKFALDNRIYMTLILFRFNKYNDYICELSVWKEVDTNNIITLMLYKLSVFV